MKQNQNEFFFYPEVKEDSNQGRQVIAGVYDSETNTITIAKSECSNKDNFCKDKGRKIALGRAKCEHKITPKFYKQKEYNRSNISLLPKVFELQSREKIQNQFLQIAKSL